VRKLKESIGIQAFLVMVFVLQPFDISHLCRECDSCRRISENAEEKVGPQGIRLNDDLRARSRFSTEPGHPL